MAKTTAGILPYRKREGDWEVFLVHPGGPFWQNKDRHAWSVGKGEPEAGEGLFHAAKREFKEETGLDIHGEFVPLEPVKQPGGKIVHAWTVEADLDNIAIESNTFSMEWPPKSGKIREFPEVDKAGWFSLEEAKEKIHKGQVGILEQLAQRLEQG